MSINWKWLGGFIAFVLFGIILSMSLEPHSKPPTPAGPASTPARPARDRGYFIEMKGAFGCRDDKNTERVQTAINENDEAAIKALENQLFSSRECIDWKEGQRVRLEDVGSLFKYRNCIVAYGTAGPCYWTRQDAIEQRYVEQASPAASNEVVG